MFLWNDNSKKVKEKEKVDAEAKQKADVIQGTVAKEEERAERVVKEQAEREAQEARIAAEKAHDATLKTELDERKKASEGVRQEAIGTTGRRIW